MKVEVDSLDKVGFGIKLEQISRLRDKEQYEEAAKVADTIEWRKVKKWSELSIAQEVYEKAGRYKDARNICVYAYNRNLGGKRLLYKLTELSIIINDLDEAEELYNELVEEAPKDSARYILQYRLYLAKGAPVEQLINILEEYKSNELEEQYEYELAILYARAGRIEDCVRECDDLILWFNEGEFVEKALELKKRFAPLSKSQQAKYEYFQEARRAGINPHISEEPEERYESAVEEEQIEIVVPEKDYNIYDTQNIQAELAKSMSVIMDSMAKAKKDESAEPFVPVVESLDVATEPEMSEEIEDTEDYQKFVSDVDEVSEPTKEIRINTHHWNNSVADIAAAQEAKESIAAMAAEAIATTTANKEIAVAIAAQEAADHAQEVIDGQIGLLDWLSSVPEESLQEVAAAKEPEVVAEPEPVVVAEPVVESKPTVEPELEPVAEPEPAVEPEPVAEPEPVVSMDTTEMAINMLTEELMKEIQEEMATKEEAIVDESPIEEYATDETGEDVEPIIEEETEEIEAEESQINEVEPIIEEEQEETIPLTEEERKYVRKYLGMEGMEEAIVRLIQSKKTEIKDNTSTSGNIVITGRTDADKTGFAINLFKSIHANDDIRQLKIAKTTAGILNKKGIMVSAEKIKGTTMIIENAGMLVPETVKEITEFMKGDTESMLVILTGEDYSVKKLFMDFPDFAALFTYSIELKKMSVNDLVVIAKNYAKEQGYGIDEKALLKVYLLIDEIQNANSGDDADCVKKLVDDAIARCSAKKSIFGRKTDSLIVLKAKHFN